jgi:hypothetical protein
LRTVGFPMNRYGERGLGERLKNAHKENFIRC